MSIKDYINACNENIKAGNMDRAKKYFDIAWKEWFESGHEFGLRDKEFLEKGLYDILNFLLIYV